jgi:hypothetical protein
MGQYNAIIKWCEKSRDVALKQLSFLEGGARVGVNDGSGWRDITQDRIADLEKEIAEMKRLIADNEKHNDWPLNSI